MARYYSLLRMYSIKLAEFLKRKDVIDEINDIWFLRVEDLWLYINGQSKKPSLREIIRTNKKYYFAYRNYVSENEIGYGFGNSISLDNKEDEDILGKSANIGVAVGNARILKDISKLDTLKKNDILITNFTDFSWTPAFLCVSGVIVEGKDFFGHAGLTAREFGIPCIVGAKNATLKIKDGQRIRIDGGTGIVTILK